MATHAQRPLSAREAQFVREYATDRNATAAAKRAGYHRKSGAALIARPSILAQIRAGQAKMLDKAELSAVRVLEEMRRLAFASVLDLFDAQGDMRPLHTLTREQAACISSIEVVMKNAAAGDGKVDRVL